MGGEHGMLRNLVGQIPRDFIPTDPRFNAGPSCIPTEYVQGLARDAQNILGQSHRGQTITSLIGSIRELMKSYLKLPEDYEVVLGNGGATFFFDVVGLNLVKKKAAHFYCGEFGQKWYRASKNIPWIDQRGEMGELGSGLFPIKMPGCDTLCSTLNETSTGVMCADFEHLHLSDDELFVVDGTSGAGQIQCDMTKVDVLFFSLQKVFASEGGLYCAIMSPKALERVKEIESTNRYIPDIMRLSTAIAQSKKNQTYTTPSLSTLYFLDRSLENLNEKGFDEVAKEGNLKTEVLYQWANEKSYLRPYVRDKRFRSSTVATIDVRDDLPVKTIISLLEDYHIAQGISSYRKLERNQFRISAFPAITLDNLERLAGVLTYLLENFAS